MDKNQMKVTVEANGEEASIICNRGMTVAGLFDEGQLRGVQASAVRINGKLETPETPLNDGDRVQTVPAAGKLA